MKFNYHTILHFLIAGLYLVFSACTKTFLEAKPNTNLVLLNTVADCQKLLSNTAVLNQTGSLPLASSDEFIVPDYPTFQAITKQTTKNAYTWERDLYGPDLKITDWNGQFAAVFYANNVLDALEGFSEKNSAEWNKTKGWALFSRAFSYYDLAQNFCNAYDEQTAASDPGLPLRQSPGIDELIQRSDLQQTYDFILDDLAQARSLTADILPTPFRNEPTRSAIYAFYARVYLSMRQYEKAEAYADSCLNLDNTLIDYNTVNANASTPFAYANAETIYQATQINDYMDVITSSQGKYAIAPEFLALYEINDLRSNVFFRKHANGNMYIRVGYSARANLFTGLAIDELYLIKAECAARRSAIPLALDYLNKLLLKRYKTGTFTARTAATPEQALQLVLTERKKELIRRGLRWSDLKRLNKEGANIAISRVLNGQTYTLPPNDPRYVFPLPADEISFTGLTQNPR